MIPILISIISYDIWFYISHVILHHKIGYPFHKQHHRKQIPNFIDTYDASMVESTFQGIGMFFPVVVYNYTAMQWAIVLMLLNTRGMMRHDPRWAFLIGNHHLLHHKYHDWNFGEYWIDSLCGTRYPNDQEYQYGLIYV
jgi:sterol desaturase/sphingolipid hydroxylase (fatty acid hydroxylase superfamily)